MKKFIMVNSSIPKKVAFGMQTSAGIRTESEKIITIHGKGSALYGGLGDKKEVFPLIEEAFGVNYKVNYQDSIDDWLKTYFIYITAMNLIQFINDNDLKRFSKSKQSLLDMIQVTKEEFSILEKAGYDIVPALQAKMINHKWFNYYFNKIYHRLPLNKFVKGSPEETYNLLKSFQQLKENVNSTTPMWDKIEKEFIQKYNEEYS